MPTLHWIGKDKVINHHMEVPFKVLEHSYGFDNGTQTDQETKSGNKIIHGDNLEALKALLPEYEGRIKCIYIDPPYNTGNEGWVYNDNVNDPKIKKWLGQVVGKESEDLSRHDKWLCMMYPRLKLLHKLLSEDGAIFISIDDIELSNLKLIMDEIFGTGSFIEYFSWYKTYSPSNLSYKSKKCLEYVLCYEKKRNNKRYKGLYKVNEADNPLIKSNNQIKTLRFPKESLESTMTEDIFFEAGKYGTKVNEVVLKNDVWFRNGKFQDNLILESKFIWTQENLESEIQKKTKIIFKGKSLAPRYDKANYDPEVPRNLMDGNDYVGTTEEGGIILKEIFGKKIFDYPKTPTLIQYLINFISDENSLILDSFAGSGTTAHAVLNLNKKDGGKRKFICIEMEDYAETITAERINRVIKGYGSAGSPQAEGTGGGFDFYELGQPLFLEDGSLNELVGVKKIRQYVYYTETKQNLQLTNNELRLNETGKQNPKSKIQNPQSYLGTHNDTAYYFHYQQDEVTTLDHAFLATMKTKAGQYVIYADNCLLTKDFMTKHNIIFKKIPRDITKF
ncbi:MAG: site-specific DNA-methyltransferase [Crocinitomicaceae bacterium]|nr:site-specific DNA-methyltransferase [Crocinitomicaceae bacterium]